MGPDDPRYVNCDEVRGENLARLSARDLQRADPRSPEVKVFAGHYGVGKTSELLRLKRFLEEPEESDQKPFLVIFSDVSRSLDLNDLDFPDLLVFQLDWYRKSLAIKEELGDRAGMASAYHQLGNVSFLRGSYEEALDWYRESLAILEDLGDRAGMAASYHQLGRLAQERASYEEALEWYRKSLAISEELGLIAGVAHSSSQMGILLTKTSRPEEAVPWTLRSLASRLKLGVGIPEIEIDLYAIRRQREALGEERFRELVEEHAESPEIAAAVLEVVAEYGEPAQEVAEPPADYEADGQSDEEA